MSDAAITISITSVGLGYLLTTTGFVMVCVMIMYVVKRNTQP
jgi:hypothetical protein